MRLVFKTKGLSLASEPRILKEKHLKLEVLEKETGVTFTAIGFGMREGFYDKLVRTKTFEMVYSIEENTFRGQSSLQLFIKDVKF